MSPEDDDADFIRSLKPVNFPSSALIQGSDLLKGYINRNAGNLSRTVRSKRCCEKYAEDELVKKDSYDELKCTVPGVPRSTFLVVFSPDGALAASTHGNHNIYVTDIRTGKSVKTLEGHPRTPWCIAFHPTSNQILASGCLGGQVRIWDLSGGSEVWTAENQSVIASIAFHPNERVLVIATYNEIYFWDWSRPIPFMQCDTGNVREKVRYVAFDKLGYKLITGISNSNQSRWERARAPVPVPRQVESSTNPYRRRITPRLVHTQDSPTATSIRDRERRITLCYRNLVREYEQLVQRYLQLYRPPRMIDRGTDPMEHVSTGTQTAGPSTSRAQPLIRPRRQAKSTRLIQGPEDPRPATSEENRQEPDQPVEDPQPSTSSGTSTAPLMAPSKVRCVIKKPAPVSVRIQTGTSTSTSTSTGTGAGSGASSSESRKHKASGCSREDREEKRPKMQESTISQTLYISRPVESPRPSSSQTSMGTQTQNPSRLLVLRGDPRDPQPSTSFGACDGNETTNASGGSEAANDAAQHGQVMEMRIRCTRRSTSTSQPSTSHGTRSGPSTSGSTQTGEQNSEYCNEFLRNAANDLRSKVVPILRAVSDSDKEELLRIFKANRENIIRPGTQLPPQIPKRSRRPVVDTTTSDSSSSDDETSQPGPSQTPDVPPPERPVPPADSRPRRPLHFATEDSFLDAPLTGESSLDGTGTSSRDVGVSFSSSGPPPVRNFNTELEQLVTSLLSEIERSGDGNESNNRSDGTGSVQTTQEQPPQPSSESPGVSRTVFRQSTVSETNWRRPVFFDRLFNDYVSPVDLRSSNNGSPGSVAGNNGGSMEMRQQVLGVIPSNMEGSQRIEWSEGAQAPSEPIFGRVSISTHASQDDQQNSGTRYLPVNLFTVYRTTSVSIQPAYTTTVTRSVTAEPTVATTSGFSSHTLHSPSERYRVRLARHDITTHSTSSLGDVPRVYGERGAMDGSGDAGNQNESSSPSSRSNLLPQTRSVTSTPIYTFSTGRTRFVSSSRRVSAFRPISFRQAEENDYMSLVSMVAANRSNDQSGNDQPINYSERDNSETDHAPRRQFESQSGTETTSGVGREEDMSSTASSPGSNYHAYFAPPAFSPLNPENIGIGNMYSNIVSDLESSLIDVRSLRGSTRPGEISDMLSSFSERLENIMEQSNTILRNLRSSMDMLPPGTSTSRQLREGNVTVGDDAGFYVRDQRTDPVPDSSPRGPPNSTVDPIASDHTYPRNLEPPSSNSGNISPLMSSLHFTISHIQRQARLLRRQVESIERIDRAMLEVSQVQLIRQLVVELIRHALTLTYHNHRTGMSSVRHMMAGTRISDNSPSDSPSEDSRSASAVNPTAAESPSAPTQTSSGAGGSAEPRPQSQPQSGTSSGGDGAPAAAALPAGPQARLRCYGHGRKTYPPSRLLRLHRQCRRTCFIQFTPRRYMGRPDRNHRQSGLSRTLFRPDPPRCHPVRCTQGVLQNLTRRLELVLTEQMRRYTISQDPQTGPSPHSRSSMGSARTHGHGHEDGENRMVLRLHGCLLRMSRAFRTGSIATILRNYRTDSAAVGPEGALRYNARHMLTTVVDELSRELESLTFVSIDAGDRVQIHDILTMSLLLSELLLLQIVDSIPPPTGMNLDPERESLTTRIDQMCEEMLQNRYSGYSAHLTRSLRLMRVTMRHAYRALGQTYNTRRNAMRPRSVSERRQLVGSINRCLNTIQRRRGNANNPSASSSNEQSSSESPNQNSPSNESEYFNTLHDLIARYSDNAVPRPTDTETQSSQRNQAGGSGVGVGSGSGPGHPGARAGNNSENDDDNDEDMVGLFPMTTRNVPPVPAVGGIRYRSVGIGVNRERETGRQVPLVQVNDVPISIPEPPPSSGSGARQPRYYMSRNRFAETISELRSNPTFGFYRPRFLHPFYDNPFDPDMYDSHREQTNDTGDAANTPNHRIQAWDMSKDILPMINNPTKNLVVGDCKIHNDASVDISSDGTILVTLLPSSRYVNVNITNRLGVYSLKWETLGQCLWTTDFYQNAVSVSLSPLSRHLIVGLASRRVPIMPNERWTIARIFRIEVAPHPRDSNEQVYNLILMRELEQKRDGRLAPHRSLNCIRWLPVSGQGLIYATNTGQLIILT